MTILLSSCDLRKPGPRFPALPDEVATLRKQELAASSQGAFLLVDRLAAVRTMTHLQRQQLVIVLVKHLSTYKDHTRNHVIASTQATVAYLDFGRPCADRSRWAAPDELKLGYRIFFAIGLISKISSQISSSQQKINLLHVPRHWLSTYGRPRAFASRWSVRLEQSLGPCPQSELHRSCFQAPAKDISVRRYWRNERIGGGEGLPVWRHTNLHNDVDVEKRWGFQAFWRLANRRLIYEHF